MDRYELMDEQELLRRQEEERQRNALLEMMRVDVPGRRLAARKTPYQPMSLLEHLQEAYRGITEVPTTKMRTIGIRG